MKRRIFLTEDGSASIYAEDLGESYHSHFGALTESLHIYIESGLNATSANPVNVLDIGFGTALNALLTWNEAIKCKRKTRYYTIEKYPLEKAEWRALGYQKINLSCTECTFEDLHLSKWNEWIHFDEYFSLYKMHSDLINFESSESFDIIYFDAFSPDIQPELWTEEIFSRLFRCLNPGGHLLTYSVKGTVKRALKTVGFNIELIPGPKGKREILRAIK